MLIILFLLRKFESYNFNQRFFEILSFTIYF